MGETPDNWALRAQWLWEQAQQAFVWNEALGYYETRDAVQSLAAAAAPDLKTAFAQSAAWGEAHPNLTHNLMMRVWPKLREETRDGIAAFFAERGLSDFSFFDHGGRAVVFRARDRQSGRIRLAQLEADHFSRSVRPVHDTVLAAFASNEADIGAYERVKLEIMPEIVPLHKLPARALLGSEAESLSFYKAGFEISHGTNVRYGRSMYDRDADMPNVGILPDGKVVSLDPEFVFGREAAMWHRAFRHGRHDLSPDMGALYGLSPRARFF